MNDRLEQYILDHIDPQPPHLAALEREVNVKLLYPRMCSGHLQGALLTMLTAMIAPRRALELGTYAGYSAQCIAAGLPDGATLDTIECDDEMEPFILQHLDGCPRRDAIKLHIGDALQVAATLPGQWDMIYIDANKRDYVAYYKALLPRLRPGGYMIADNTLWDGKVADPTAHRDAQTTGIMAFNDLVAADPRVSRVILPLRDGLTLIRRLK